MTQFNEAIQISDNLARKVIGTSWCADSDSKILTEVLGRTKPIAHIGEWFKNAREAGEEYGRVPLPSSIRLPRGIPLALENNVASARVSTRLHILDFSELMGKGLTLEECTIELVEYSPAPAHVQDIYDFVATSVHYKRQHQFRVRLGTDANGFQYVEGSPMAKRPSWLPIHNMAAYIQYQDAAAAADQFATTMIKAINWRENSTVS